MNLQFPVSANDPEFDNYITQEFKSVMKEKAPKMISDENGLKKFNHIVQKAARYLTSISKEKLKLNVTFDSISGMPDATVTCLDCSMTFKPSHAADRYFYFSDLINQTHSHFKYHSSGNTSEKQSVIDTFFKKSENYKSQQQKRPKLSSSVKEQFKCEGLGKMIGLNCFNSNESSLVFANENSAWAKLCVGKTSNNNKVCSECMKVLKSSAIRKKAQRIRNANKVTKPPEPQSKFKPFSLYPAQARNALRKAAKEDRNLKKKSAYHKSTNKKLRSLLIEMKRQKFSKYIKDVALHFRRDKGEGLTEVTSEVLDDIQKNSHAISKFGYRHSRILQSLSVMIYNRSQTVARLLNENLPMVFSSLSHCAKLRKPKGTVLLKQPGIQKGVNMVKSHFLQYGWQVDGVVGPIQFVQDSTRVRELVKADAKHQIMIGFKARKNECKQWEFSIPYKSVIDIKCAFLSNMKADYVLLGLYTAMTF